MNYSLQSLALSRFYEETPSDEKSKLLSKMFDTMELDHILSNPTIIKKIREFLTNHLISVFGSTDKTNMINACLNQMENCGMFLYFYVVLPALEDMYKSIHPERWVKYYMDGEKMVLLEENQVTNRETKLFNFQRDIIETGFNTTHLIKLYKDTGKEFIWYAW